MRTSTSTIDLLAAVNEHPGKTVKELVDYVTVGQGRAYQILAELRRAGHVIKDGRRRWFPAAGASRRTAGENFVTIRMPLRALVSNDPKVILAIYTLATFQG